MHEGSRGLVGVPHGGLELAGSRGAVQGDARGVPGLGRGTRGVPGVASARGVVHESRAGAVDRARGHMATSDRRAHATRSTEVRAGLSGSVHACQGAGVCGYVILGPE